LSEVQDLLGKTLHVLLVDDDDQARAATHEYLMAMGIDDITIASNGADALKCLSKDPTIDLVLSDWDMPLMDGHSLLKQIRQNPQLQHLPFIMLTSPRSSEIEKVMLAAESLVDSYIVKPFRMVTLKEKMDTVLSKSIHGPQKIVVVAEDDQDALKTLLDYLKHFGFKKIKTFDNGQSALDFLQAAKDSVGLVISDWEMPRLNGVELLVECRQVPRLKATPFIIVTSQSSMENMKIKKAAESMVDDYLLKPFRGSDLKDRIDTAIRVRRFQGALKDYAQEGFSALERGHVKAAQNAFEKALKIDPRFSQSIEGLGDVHHRDQSIQAALPFYQRAVAINPYEEQHYIKLAWAYEKTGEDGRALNLLLMALQYAGTTIQIRKSLSKLYIKKNAYAKAADELKHILHEDPEDQESEALLLQVQDSLEKRRA